VAMMIMLLVGIYDPPHVKGLMDPLGPLTPSPGPVCNNHAKQFKLGKAR